MARMTFGIIGAGGFGRDVLPAVRHRYARDLRESGIQLAFVSESTDVGETRNGVPVIALQEFLEMGGDRRFAVAIADSAARARIVAQCETAGAVAFDIIAPSAIILDANEVGTGLILCDMAMITCNVRIGRHFHGNIYSYVEHDCWIGDYVTFAPSVRCNGNIRIEDCAYIGAGAVVRQGRAGKPLVIGEGAIVGMGAVV